MKGSINNNIGEAEGDAFDEQPPCTSQIAPGVLETRRLIIKAPLAAVVALALSKAGLGRNLIPGTARSRSEATTLPYSMPIESGQLDFEGFFQECASLAKQAVGEPGLNEDAHLYRIAAVAARLNAKTIPETKTGKFGGLNPAVNFGPVRVAPPLGVILWRLDPGAVLPPHNHTPADVLSLCLAGEARVRHFDIAGEAPPYSSRNSFIIRETRNMLLTPGRASGLTQTSDNIHTFHAGDQGAVGIDINTFLPGNKGFSFLQIADRPIDIEKRTYEAVWTKVG
jgi:hypothetical protein